MVVKGLDMERVLCRTDASIKYRNEHTTVGLGGVVFDRDSGKQLGEFSLCPPTIIAKYIGAHIDFAEALAVYEMVNFCAQSGHKNLYIITDNQPVYQGLAKSRCSQYATSCIINKTLRFARNNGMKLGFEWEPRENNKIADKLASSARIENSFCSVDDLLELTLAKSTLQKLIHDHSIAIHRMDSHFPSHNKFRNGVFLSKKNFFCTEEHSSRTLLLAILGYLAVAPIYRKRMNLDLIEKTLLDEEAYVFDVAMASAANLLNFEQELNRFVCFPAGCVEGDYEKSIQYGQKYVAQFGCIELCDVKEHKINPTIGNSNFACQM